MSGETRRARYEDEGAVALVEVLSDSTESKGMRRVALRLIEQEKPSPMHGDLGVAGDEWVVTCSRGYEAYVGWNLEYLEEGAP